MLTRVKANEIPKLSIMPQSWLKPQWPVAGSASGRRRNGSRNSHIKTNVWDRKEEEEALAVSKDRNSTLDVGGISSCDPPWGARTDVGCKSEPFPVAIFTPYVFEENF